MYLASQVGMTLYNERAVAIAGSHSGAPSYADDRATWRLIVVPVRYSYTAPVHSYSPRHKDTSTY